jgi:hypothetical protein
MLVDLQFSVDQENGVCSLVLDLAEDDKNNPRTLRAEFSGVSGLNIRDFGGGKTQLLHLVVEDIGDRQLDRTNYEVRELERDSLFFACRTVTLRDTSIG